MSHLNIISNNNFQDSVEAKQSKLDTILISEILDCVKTTAQTNQLFIKQQETCLLNNHPVKAKLALFQITAITAQKDTVALFDSTVKGQELISVVSDSIIRSRYDKSVNSFHWLKADEANFDYKPFQVFIEKGKVDQSSQKILSYETHIFHRSHLNWTLVVGLISILLLLIIKSYYLKFMKQVVFTLVNFQIAEKMLREKNILARRTFFVLNSNFLLIFSLFIQLVLIAYSYSITGHYIIDYLIIIGLVLVFLFVRLLLLYIIGYLFETMPIIFEYIHNLYLVNKNVGIILLPVVFSAIYTPLNISKIILTAGFVIICVASIFKIIRGFQIIMRNEVLLFYSILYLCTLELLPIVLGFKLFFSLR
jgi:hypothetical protein